MVHAITPIPASSGTRILISVKRRDIRTARAYGLPVPEPGTAALLVLGLVKFAITGSMKIPCELGKLQTLATLLSSEATSRSFWRICRTSTRARVMGSTDGGARAALGFTGPMLRG